MGARAKGGATGQDVVDEEDVLPGKALGMTEAERVVLLLIGLTFGVAARHLRGGVVSLIEIMGVDGQMPMLPQNSGNRFGLIVAACEAATPVDRDGEDARDVVGPTAAVQFRKKKVGQFAIDVRLSVIFGRFDEGGKEVITAVVAEGGPMLERDAANEPLFGEIVGRGVLDGVQAFATGGTEESLVGE